MTRYGVAVVTLLLAAGPANAGAYSFTDNFSDGTVVSGWLQGTKTGGTVSGISDLSVFVNGTAFANNGALNASGFGTPNGAVSVNGSGNNLYVDDGAGHTYLSIAPFQEAIVFGYGAPHFDDGTHFHLTTLTKSKFGFVDSYANGMTVTGSVTGYQAGNVVFGISDIHAKMNGVAFGGLSTPLGPNDGFFMSLDGSSNNFSFTFGGSGPFGYYEDVATSPWGPYHDAFLALGPGNFLDAPQSVTHHFSITSISAIPAPEPASWMTMVVGFGLIGAFARAHRIRPAQAT